MLAMLEKLINEHGSSSILRERLELFSDKYSMLEEKNEHLSSKNAELESRLNDANAEISRLNSILVEQDQPGTSIKLGDKELILLQHLFDNNHNFQIETLAAVIDTDPNTAKYHINNLLEHKLLYQALRVGGPATYKINNDGIKFIVESKNT